MAPGADAAEGALSRSPAEGAASRRAAERRRPGRASERIGARAAAEGVGSRGAAEGVGTASARRTRRPDGASVVHCACGTGARATGSRTECSADTRHSGGTARDHDRAAHADAAVTGGERCRAIDVLTTTHDAVRKRGDRQSNKNQALRLHLQEAKQQAG